MSTHLVEAQHCEPSWTTFPGGGIDNTIWCSVVFDEDGEGPRPPALFFGGDMFTAGGLDTLKVARLEDPIWSEVGGGTDNIIRAMAVFDDDGNGPNLPALYVGGSFIEAGGQAINRIAKWDGAVWAPLSSGVNDVVLSLAEFDPDGPGPEPAELIVGGAFTTAGGITANGIAKWDGQSWSNLDIGVAGSDALVGSLKVFDVDDDGPILPTLFVGGAFETAGGVEASGIAEWDGTTWSSLGAGLSPNGANTFEVFDEDGDGPNLPLLFAGGSFNTAGAVEANNIARWDGETWSAVGAGTGNSVTALLVHDDDGDGPNPSKLYVGGLFSYSDGTGADKIASWDGVELSQVGGGLHGGGGMSKHWQATIRTVLASNHHYCTPAERLIGQTVSSTYMD